MTLLGKCKVVLGLLLLLEIIKCATAYEIISTPQFTDIGLDRQNPVTGFYPYGPVQTPLNVPASLEYIALPLNSIVTGRNKYDWTKFEALLDGLADRKRQAVVRIYIDFPILETGIPKYLLDAGLKTRRYTVNGNIKSLQPDYSDARLMQCIYDFITEFGRLYDGDKRIGILQLGLIGFWGEWHTWPETYARFNFPSVAGQHEVLRRYNAAFKKTLLQVGINLSTLPVVTTYAKAREVRGYRIGLSDDSLLGGYYDNFIEPNLKLSNLTMQYLKAPIGGEILPSLQPCLFKATPCYDGNIGAYLERYKLSTALFAQIGGLTAVERTKALTLARQFGYRFYVSSVKVGINPRNVTLTVNVMNNGYTRAYFPIFVGTHVNHSVSFFPRSIDGVLPGNGIELMQTLFYTVSNLPFRMRLFLYSDYILPSQVLYLSNRNVNEHGELYFNINPRTRRIFP